MKKICLIIHSLGIGGMEKNMHQLAFHFSQRKDTEVHLILIGRNRTIAFQLPDDINVHMPSFTFNNSTRFYHSFKTIKYIRSIIKELEPDVILSFGELWNNLVLLSLYRIKIPVFISDRSQPGKNLGRFHNFLRHKLYPGATGYIAQTGKAALLCREMRLNRNIKVIGNPVRVIKPDPSIEKENIVLFVGRLIPTKHVDQLIQIFNDINLPGWKLYIVGGDAKNMKLSVELVRMVKTLDAEDRIILEGEKLNLDYYYNRSKIFAFTSSSEGFPNVIGEALAAGIPVVAYDCDSGPSEMINDGENGFLIPLFDRDRFKHELKRLMNDRMLREKMSEKAVKSIVKFEVGETINQYYKFIMNDEDQ